MGGSTIEIMGIKKLKNAEFKGFELDVYSYRKYFIWQNLFFKGQKCGHPISALGHK